MLDVFVCGTALHLYYAWRCFQRIIYCNARGRGYVMVIEALRRCRLFDGFDDAAIHRVGVIFAIRCRFHKGGHERLLALVGIRSRLLHRLGVGLHRRWLHNVWVRCCGELLKRLLGIASLWLLVSNRVAWGSLGCDLRFWVVCHVDGKRLPLRWLAAGICHLRRGGQVVRWYGVARLWVTAIRHAVGHAWIRLHLGTLSRIGRELPLSVPVGRSGCLGGLSVWRCRFGCRPLLVIGRVWHRPLVPRLFHRLHMWCVFLVHDAFRFFQNMRKRARPIFLYKA